MYKADAQYQQEWFFECRAKSIPWSLLGVTPFLQKRKKAGVWEWNKQELRHMTWMQTTIFPSPVSQGPLSISGCRFQGHWASLHVILEECKKHWSGTANPSIAGHFQYMHGPSHYTISLVDQESVEQFPPPRNNSEFLPSQLWRSWDWRHGTECFHLPHMWLW